MEQLLKWNYLDCALEKLTQYEALKVVRTVADTNRSQAWRQLNFRFELELEAQTHKVLLDLHNITAADTLEETKVRLVELKVRIASADDLLGMQTQNMLKMPALIQVIDPITEQHVAMLKGTDLNTFLTRVINFTYNASIGCGPIIQPNVKVVTEKDMFQPDMEEHDGQDEHWVRGLGRCPVPCLVPCPMTHVLSPVLCTVFVLTCPVPCSVLSWSTYF